MRRFLRGGAWTLAVALASACGPAAGQDDVPGTIRASAGLDVGRLRAFSAELDNDSLATWPHDDRWYTSGLALRWLHETGGQDLHARVADFWCGASGCGAGARLYRLTSIVHRIYNPVDTRHAEPQPFDRPYGGWLSIGTGVLVREPATQERLELAAGVIGPGALGEQVQNGVHRALGLDRAQGWERQLRPRAALQAAWSKILRHGTAASRVDWVHRFSLEAGTVRGRASAGAMLRVGAPPEGPTWPGEASAPWGGQPEGAGRWHLFVGLDARAVGWDRTIDGPASGYVPRVRPEPFGADAFAGASVRVARRWRVDLSMTVRATDFDSPAGPAYPYQRFGTLLLRWVAP